MDIVDTFNHLIPTEHLDDALFLGSNLENEGCEEFSASALEDSLKNMLSDKDPMLGSASNQFCLPVVDSNEPNFQMPCSTVVGLDDIMDEGVVKESGNDTIDEEELILPNRNLRDKVEENSVRSPRKSPRLMAQEQVRSLRQSTIAKRASAAPGASTKKASGKPGPRAAARPAEAAEEAERHRESRRGGRHAGQRAAAPGVAVPPACVQVKEEAEPGGAGDLNGGALAGSPEPGGDPLFSFSEKEEHGHGRDASASGKVREAAAIGEMGETGNAEPASGDPGRAPREEPPELEDPAPSGARSARAACPMPREREQRLAGSSPSHDGASTAGGDPECSGQRPEDAGFSEAALELAGAEALELDGSVLDNALGDIPEPHAERFSAVGGVETEASGAAGLPDDRSSHVNAVPIAEPKSSRSRLARPAAAPQPAAAAEQPKKPVAAKQEPGRHRSRAQARSGKRNAGEPEAQLGLPHSAKVRKKQAENDTKAQPWNSAARPVKGQAHSLPKKTPQDQSLVQASKPLSVPSLNDKSLGPPGSSKESPNSAHTGHVPHQKASRPLPPAAAVRANSQAKEELEHVPGEHVREEDKQKLKKPERHLQPRQRRSSKNFSVDEPPLFIPDNIATVKREGSLHSAPFESKCVWTPSKQCGFCKKPHGNRFMVGCGRCDDWFHGDCVGLTLTQAQQMGEEDKEYVCVKCCAEGDKKTELADGDAVGIQANPEAPSEEKTMEREKLGLLRHTPASDKAKSLDEPAKHKAKAPKRESVEGKNSSDGRESEMKRWQLAPVRKTGQSGLARRASEERSERAPKEPAAARTGAHEKQEVKKKKVEKGVPSAPPAASKPSADQIRQSVRHSLKDILMKRLADSNLKMPEEKATKVATKIEKELFSFFRDTDAKYKNKYRSLMFNLKDPKNSMLFKKVLKGEVTPDHLIKMSPEELASKELAAWRRRENRHTIEMIEKEQREVERRPITKITHKGEIEIESDAPMKEQEVPMESQEAAANKSLEKTEGCEKQESDSTSKDSTSQHRQHLFDLNCKICTGRMAPPADDLSPKKVKVAVGVSRKHSDNEADSIADALSAASTMLTSELFEEEKQDSPKSTFSPAPRPEMPGTVEVESTFLARLNFIWKGFINMPSVAKVVTKAYPVSGSPENLTEDLPDSIQVGGRISPQTVWDYVEKIKASGTKEICVVRFTPVTEEDQISYTLLFAYFSSRRRYGVAANNMKQVKDMYLIPLGAADKIPHPLVPFDGPGLELHRPNLLLGLIIRQRLKRPHGGAQAAETPDGGTPALPPDKKSKLDAAGSEEESDFFNSLTAVLHKHRNKPAPGAPEELPAAGEPLAEAARQEPARPLRFLPGVLVGWESQPAALDLASKPLPVDDILQSLLGPGQGPGATQEIPFLGERASPDAERADAGADAPGGEDEPVPEAARNPAVAAEETLAGLSLRGKPPDVSTEAFLTTLAGRSAQDAADGRDRPCPRALPPEPETTPQEPAAGSEAPGAPRPPQCINLKRDPRQAAGRSQPAAAPDGRDGDAAGREEDKGGPPDPAPEPPAPEERPGPAEQSPAHPRSLEPTRAPDAPSADEGHAAAPAPGPQDGAAQTIEAVVPFRRGAALEAGGAGPTEFPPKGANFTPRSTSPRAGFPPPRPPGLPPLKAPGFPFPGFGPHLPPPLLPPPAFGFAHSSVLLWPPVVHLPGPPRALAPRYLGPPAFPPLRDARRPERRHGEPWARPEPAERPFSRGPGDRSRGHSDPQRPKREPERHQRRERSQDPERKRDDGHKDRARPAHGDRGVEGRAGHKKPDKPRSDEHEREKNKHRDGDKDRDRHHSDRAKSKR